MYKKIVFLLIALMVCLNEADARRHVYTLVIDAGHGGKDTGTSHNGAKEKSINLAVALAFGRYVENNCSDVKVIYTRKTDVFIPLHERADIANRNKADAFISIHTNALPGRRPKALRGLETYTMGMRRSDEKLSAAKRENEVITIEDNYRQHYAGYDPRSPESMIVFEFMNEQNMVKSVELAQCIQRHVCSTAKRPDGGVKQDAFLVLRETSMPACLVELGYITTASEAAYLTNKKNVDLMGRGLYQAFVAFKNKQKGDGNAPKVTPDEDQRGKASKSKRRKVSEEEDNNLGLQQDEAELAVRESENNNGVATAPVFKVQILASDKKLKPTDRRLKRRKDVNVYKEGAMWKYTVGASTDYNKIYRLRKQLLSRFPTAFIIAFQDGEKVDVNDAIRVFKKKKVKSKKR